MTKGQKKKHGKDEVGMGLGGSSKGTHIPRQMISDRVRVTLPYFMTARRAPGAVFGSYQFNLESLFDPDRTAAGHQPMSLDIWNNFYVRYRVWNVRYTVTLGSGNSAGESILGAIVPSVNNTSVFSDSSTCVENIRSRHSTTQSGAPKILFTGNYNLPATIGMSTTQYAGDDSYEALFSASPTQTVTLNVYYEHISGGNVVTDMTVKLEYDAELFERKSLPTS